MIALVAAGAIAANRIYTQANHRFLNQAAPVFASAEDISVEMLNEETGVRGYVITGDPATLAPYKLGRKYSKLELDALAEGAPLDPKIPVHLAAVQTEVDALNRYFESEIALVRSGPAGTAAGAQARILQGKAHFDRFRKAAGKLDVDAADLVKRMHTEQHGTLVTSLVFLGFAGCDCGCAGGVAAADRAAPAAAAVRRGAPGAARRGAGRGCLARARARGRSGAAARHRR